MEDLLNAIGEAWEKVKVKLMEDEGELRKRVGRVRGLLARPPRAWCLAVRASDTRITTTHAIITPGWAVHPVRRGGRAGENEGGGADHTALPEQRVMRRGSGGRGGGGWGAGWRGGGGGGVCRWGPRPRGAGRRAGPWAGGGGRAGGGGGGGRGRRGAGLRTIRCCWLRGS